MKPRPTTVPFFHRPAAWTLSALLACGGTPMALANETASAHGTTAHATTETSKTDTRAAPAASNPTEGTDTIGRLKAVIERHSGKNGNVSLRVGGHVIASTRDPAAEALALNAHGGESAHKPAKTPSSHQTSREYIRARAAVLSGHAAPEAHTPAVDQGHEVHWEHQGDNGPQNWAHLKPEFSTCATGQRQSPVHILETDTVPGKAEVLQFDYHPSGGSVVNNGHTVQVDLAGNNTLYVRGSAYKLVQFHFHHPAEERVNYKGFSMVAHLVHKNDEGQLAVVAVLIDPGVENPLIDQVWTRMPLDVNDRVGLPAGLLDMTQLLPTDQRYYQFIGSLTTPPCTEGVLWLVMKQPMTVSREQLKLFTRLYPMNARPIQALNGRLVREAM